MRLTLAEPKYLKESLSVVAELVTEARIKVTKNSLEIIAMDPANVAMVIFRLLSSAFTEYSIDEDVEIGLNLANLKQMLRRVGPNDMLTLEMMDNKLDIKIQGQSSRTFSVPILEMEEGSQKVPELNFPIKVTMNSGMFNDAIEDADIVAESVAFALDEDKFVVSAEGDLSKAKIEIKQDDDTTIAKDDVTSAKAKYSIEYLKKMVSGGKLSDKVNINFKTDYPLKLEYKVVDKMLLAFILAPRVEND
ncbi:MAG: proliferating cell nuclear antigen (pcna) [Candidatus Woesearchaeota archaeon]